MQNRSHGTQYVNYYVIKITTLTKTQDIRILFPSIESKDISAYISILIIRHIQTDFNKN